MNGPYLRMGEQGWLHVPFWFFRTASSGSLVYGSSPALDKTEGCFPRYLSFNLFHLHALQMIIPKISHNAKALESKLTTIFQLFLPQRSIPSIALIGGIGYSLLSLKKIYYTCTWHVLSEVMKRKAVDWCCLINISNATIFTFHSIMLWIP